MAALYSLGSNGSGQLGINHIHDVSVPKLAIFPGGVPEISHICAGGNHTLVLTTSGDLYVTGDHTTGAVGLTPTDAKSTIFRDHDSGLEDFGVVRFATATWEASIIVREDDAGRAAKVYSFGTGNKGELGLGELIFKTPKCQLLSKFPPGDTEVVDLAASVSHVVAVLSNGEVWAWGNGRKGQIGEPAEVVHAPRKVQGLDFKVVRAVCGREFTCFLGSPETGEIKVFGTDRCGLKTVCPAGVIDWKDVGATWGGIYILMYDGTLLSWGRNDHGQLAPPGLPSLSQIAVGSEHVLAVSDEGDVLAWGWGEHGNCGPSTDEHGDVKSRWNVVASSKYLPPAGKIKSIGAGCATSWIYLSG